MCFPKPPLGAGSLNPAGQRDYDGVKKVKGRKRHLLVDTEGFVLQANVHSAKVMDYEGIKLLLGHALPWQGWRGWRPSQY